MRSYRPEELFDAGRANSRTRRASAEGRPSHGRQSACQRRPAAARPAPAGLPRLRRGGSKAREDHRRSHAHSSVRCLRDVLQLNRDPANFRIMGPDETASNRLDAVFEVTDRHVDRRDSADGRRSPGARWPGDGDAERALCQGWLEGYLLTGRHGFFSCYEAFIHIVDSMFNQHAKWLKVTPNPWRRPIASLNYLLTSHVWRQDHNGFSHQDPGFIDHVVNKKADVVRVYLPPDANTLLSVADHCLRSRNYVNVIVAGKQPGAAVPRWTRPSSTAPAASASGMGEQRSGRRARTSSWPAPATCPDAGDAGGRRPAAHEHLPDLKVRVVNVVDLMPLQPASEHPHGLSDRDFDALFTTDKPDRLRLSRLPVADPPAHLPPHQSRQPARPRLQGGRHHDDPVRHGDAERPGPLPPGDGRDRPGARAGLQGSPCAPADGRPPAGPPAVHPRPRQGPARRQRLGVARPRLPSVSVSG